jgi:hypothetical protein
MLNPKTRFHGVQTALAIWVLFALAVILPRAVHAEPSCSLEYNLQADLPIGQYPPDHVENEDFMSWSWNHFLSLNAPAVGGQVNLDGDNVTQWSRWSSTADLVNQSVPGASGSRFYPTECESIAEYEDYRVLQPAGKVDDSFLEAQVRGLSSHPVLDSAGKFLRYEILISPAMYDDVLENQWNQASVLKATTENVVFSCGFEEYEGGDPADPRMGAIVIKAAWREAAGIDESAGDGRYHKEKLLVYNPSWRNSSGQASCELKEMALVGMHVAHKTEKQPNWIWMTFEHEDNAPDCLAQPTGGSPGSPEPANSACPADLMAGEWSLAPGNCENDPKCAACNVPPAPNGAGICDNPFVSSNDGWCLDLPPNPVGGLTRACKQVPVSTHGYCSDDRSSCTTDGDCTSPAVCEENYAGVRPQNEACLAALGDSPWSRYELISAQWTTNNGQDTNTPAQRCQNLQANVATGPYAQISQGILRERVTLANGVERPILGNTSMETYDRANCIACHARSYLNGSCSNDANKVCSRSQDCDDGGTCVEQYSTDTMYFMKLEIAEPPALRFDEGEASLVYHHNQVGRSDDRLRLRIKSEDFLAGEVGSKNDPRCHGLPKGSAKAEIRFIKDGAVVKNGAIELPCEGWRQIEKKNRSSAYLYWDRRGELGPCKWVVIRDGQGISAQCTGEQLPTEVTHSTDDSPLQVMVVSGNRRYCAELEHDEKHSRRGKKKKKRRSVLQSSETPEVCPDL